MEFEDQEDQEEISLPAQAGFEPVHGNSSTPVGAARIIKMSGCVGDAGGKKQGISRYKECLKNHAVSINGGHAVDGCGEFMPAGEEGTLDALKCAACNCHRNFHRKETEGDSSVGGFHHASSQFSPYYRVPPPPAAFLQVPHRPPLALPSTSGGRDDQEDVSGGTASGGGGSGSTGKKRFRTKFTPEQKEKMLSLAERLGWRIQKHDEVAVQQFCMEAGVKRHVLKVWMHNNKRTLDVRDNF